MEVILLKEVSGVGHKGDVKNLTDGYVRNFLLPRKLAVIATPGRVQNLRASSAHEAATKSADQQGLLQSIRSLNGREFTTMVKANEQGTLFSRVTVQDVSDILQAAGCKVPTKNIVLVEPIKRVGLFSLKATAANTTSQFTLVVDALV